MIDKILSKGLNDIIIFKHHHSVETIAINMRVSMWTPLPNLLAGFLLNKARNKL